MHINDILTRHDIEAIRQRFASKVDRRGPKECWPWLAGTDDGGYGVFSVQRAVFKAHRVAWVLAKGPIPDSGTKRSLSVCHECDTPLCMNVEAHHFLGTDRRNIDDMLAKQRQQHGEEHYDAKLTAEAVRYIRLSSLRQSELAQLYGVTSGTIYAVLKGRTWKHVK